MFKILFFSLHLAGASYVMASPDWHFTDADDYNGAYLHVFEEGASVRFLFADSDEKVATIPGIVIPTYNFNKKALTSHIEKLAFFSLQEDMLTMLKDSNAFPTWGPGRKRKKSYAKD